MNRTFWHLGTSPRRLLNFSLACLDPT